MIRLRERWNSFNSFGEMLGREKPQSDVERMGCYIQLTNERGIDQWLLQVEERLLQPPGCQSRRLLKNWEKNKICQTMRRDWPFSIVLNCEKWTFLKRGHARGEKMERRNNKWINERKESIVKDRSGVDATCCAWLVHPSTKRKKRGGGFQVLAKEKIVPTFDAQSVFFFIIICNLTWGYSSGDSPSAYRMIWYFKVILLSRADVSIWTVRRSAIFLLHSNRKLD